MPPGSDGVAVDVSNPAPTIGADVTASVAGARLGERATLVQFSSAFCAPCRATRTVLDRVVDAESGVAHVEVDAEMHLELVRRVGVEGTPTTLLLDGDGWERFRATGVPRMEQVRAVLTGLAPGRS